MATSKLSIFAAGLALAASGVSAACSKYTVDTTESTYAFNHYTFLDFRNRTGQEKTFLQSQEFTDQYRISTWQKQPSGSNYGFDNLVSNVKVADNDAAPGQTMLSLTTLAGQDGSHSASEIESTAKDYYYASVRMGVRVTGAAGACAGLFFYHSDTQETDIEILTQEQAPHKDAETQQPASATKSQLHFTNQPHATKTVDLTPLNSTSNVLGNSKFVAAPTWENFNTYRIDWVPSKTYWWQNSEMSHTETKNMIQNPSAWLFNIWSTGDPTWSGIMAAGTQARMDIAWIEIAYNKESEGVPTTVASDGGGSGTGAEGSCALGVGDGVNLNDVQGTKEKGVTGLQTGTAAAAGPGTTAPETAASASASTSSTGSMNSRREARTSYATIEQQTKAKAMRRLSQPSRKFRA